MLWETGGILQTNITGLWGECSQYLDHSGFAPTHGVCAFPVYTAQATGCSAVEPSKVGPGLCALPRSKSLRFRFSGTPASHRLGWACVLCPSQVQAAQVTRCLASTHSPGVMHLIIFPIPAAQFPGCTVGAQSQVYHVSPLGSWSLWPSRWMSTIQDPRKTWLVTGSLLTVWWRVPSLGPRLPLAFWLWLSPTCLSASGWGGAGLQLASSPLVFT